MERLRNFYFFLCAKREIGAMKKYWVFLAIVLIAAAAIVAAWTTPHPDKPWVLWTQRGGLWVELNSFKDPSECDAVQRRNNHFAMPWPGVAPDHCAHESVRPGLTRWCEPSWVLEPAVYRLPPCVEREKTEREL